MEFNIFNVQVFCLLRNNLWLKTMLEGDVKEHGSRTTWPAPLCQLQNSLHKCATQTMSCKSPPRLDLSLPSDPSISLNITLIFMLSHSDCHVWRNVFSSNFGIPLYLHHTSNTDVAVKVKTIFKVILFSSFLESFVQSHMHELRMSVCPLVQIRLSVLQTIISF